LELKNGGAGGLSEASPVSTVYEDIILFGAAMSNDEEQHKESSTGSVSGTQRSDEKKGLIRHALDGGKSFRNKLGGEAPGVQKDKCELVVTDEESSQESLTPVKKRPPKKTKKVGARAIIVNMGWNNGRIVTVAFLMNVFTIL